MNAQLESSAPSIRAMRPSDLDAVAALEAQSYEFPWGRSIFSDCLIAGYASFVLDAAGSVAGYAIMSVAAAEAHILNLCIADSRRRGGLGQQMLDHLLAEASDQQVEQMFLEVRPSNLAALELYRKAGFSQLGLRKAYYKAPDGREDAQVLAYKFGVDFI